MAQIIESNGKYVYTAEEKVGEKWMKIIGFSEFTTDTAVFPTAKRANDFMEAHGINGNIVTIESPAMVLYGVSKESGYDMGIKNKSAVYFITGNIGGGWPGTDEGFADVEDLIILIDNSELLNVAKNLGAFLDDNEWFFSSKKNANKFYNILKKELESAGVKYQ